MFESWAVTKGPSRAPAEKRLAVEIDDHPLDYGDFEGTIPKGEYGGGNVMLWDRGFWAPAQTKDIAAALRKGELKFTLAGAKLQGSFVLVRMKFDRYGGKLKNWLVIQHRDEFASEDEDVTEADKSIASARSMDQITARKGCGAETFMASGTSADPGAIWHSNKAASKATTTKTTTAKPKGRRRSAASRELVGTTP